MIFLGSIVNAITVILGTFVGIIAKKGINENSSKTIVYALGMVTFTIGATYALDANNILVVIISLLVGIIIGEFLNIEGQIDKLGSFIENTMKSKLGGGENNKIAQGFVTASLLYCVGSMTIMGSLESGISNNHTILYTKAVMDGIMSVIFASTLGIGVAFSALSIMVYQGTITLLANYIAPFLNDTVITEMNGVGGIMLMCLALNILEIKKIKVGNMLPAIVMPFIVMKIMSIVGM